MRIFDRGSNQIEITWETPSNEGTGGIQYYELIYSNDTIVEDVGNRLYSFRSLGGNAGNYTYRVRAVNALGTGPQASRTYTWDGQF